MRNTGKIGALLLACVLQAAFSQMRPVAAISHRGEHLHHPENTIPAFQAAIDAGADFIEVDVRTTADGRLVLMHDATVDRCTNGHGEVARMTFEEIRRLDAGVRSGPAFAGIRVPSFEEALAMARGKIGVYIDAKSISARDLVDAVGKYGMEGHVVVYGSAGLHRDIRRLNPGIGIMPEAGSVETVRRLIGELKPPVIAFDARDFQEEVIAVVRAAKLDLFVDRLGAADTPQSWEDAVRRGATGIQSDHPAELVQFLRAKGWHK
jgi:glycerophosphoryl diester phosphodiesterase